LSGMKFRYDNTGNKDKKVLLITLNFKN